MTQKSSSSEHQHATCTLWVLALPVFFFFFLPLSSESGLAVSKTVTTVPRANLGATLSMSKPHAAHVEGARLPVDACWFMQGMRTFRGSSLGLAHVGAVMCFVSQPGRWPMTKAH